MAKSPLYLIIWCLGYTWLWSLVLRDAWSATPWQVATTLIVSAMMIPWWRQPPNIWEIIKRKKRNGSNTTYRRRRTPRPNAPLLTSAKHDDSHELHHGQIKLASSIIRAYMMQPYYRTYGITYQHSTHDCPANIKFRRQRIESKGCQYYYDKAFAHLVSCYIEQISGFMSDHHSQQMDRQAQQACRQVAMELDPEHLEETSQAMYQTLRQQADEMAVHLRPALLSLAPRITPSQRQTYCSLSEAEILHWFEYLDRELDEARQDAATGS